MDQNVVYIIIGSIALAIGIIAGKFIFAKNTQKLVEEAQSQAQKIISEGELKAETLTIVNPWLFFPIIAAP